MAGILACGVYIPRQRLARSAIAAAHAWALPALRAHAKGARAFCNWDEDVVTMAVEAARDCLRGEDRLSVTRLQIASTNFPYTDLQHSSLVAAALGMRNDLETLDHASSQRASTSSLIEALCADRPGQLLLVASDAPDAMIGSEQEMQYGAGAAAFLIGNGAAQARLLASRSVTAPFIDHFRSREARSDYFWEERWIREEGYLKIAVGAVEVLMREQGLGPEDIAHFALATPFAQMTAAVARKLGIAADRVHDGLARDCGYSGAAQPMLLLAGALERARAGDRILLVGFGQGCDVLLLETTEFVKRAVAGARLAKELGRGRQQDDYLRMLSCSGQIKYAWGMRGEKDSKTALTQQYRSADQMFGFLGGRCRQCGTVQFPRLGKCVNPACHASASLDPTPLADEAARVLTFTVDWLQYTPSPPFNFGLVQFDNGARVLMEMVDVDPADLDVGIPLRMVFRIKERDNFRRYDRYFWKAVPAASAET